MLGRVCSLAIVAFLGLGPAAAQELPPVVEKNLQSLVKDCEGKMEVARKSVQRVDLNEDGIADFVLDGGALGCEMASYYCGSAGCTLTIFVSHQGGFAQVWDSNARGWKAVKIRGKPGIQFDLHGSACNRVGAAPCRQRYTFDGFRLRPVK